MSKAYITVKDLKASLDKADDDAVVTFYIDDLRKGFDYLNIEKVAYANYISTDIYTFGIFLKQIKKVK